MTQKTTLAMHHLRSKWALKYRTDADMGSRKHRYHPGQARGSRAARTWMSQVRLESPRRPARQRGSGRADEATCGREGADHLTGGPHTASAGSRVILWPSGSIQTPRFEVGKADSAEKVVLRGGEAGSRFAGLAKRRVF